MEHLVRASSISALYALGAYRGTNPGQLLLAGTSVGMAVESALKAALATVSPVLIADVKKNHQSAVWLSGSSIGPFDSSAVRTLGGLELLQVVRLAFAGQEGLPSVSSCEQIFTVRNTAAHLGVVESAKLDAAVINMAAVLTTILELLAREGEEFWGVENYDLITELLDEKASAVRLAIAAKKAQAQRKFERFLETVPRAQQEAVFSALEARFVRLASRTDRTLASCPICDRDGLLDLYVHEPDLDFSGWSLTFGPPDGSRTGVPEHFECPVCGLVLEDEEEIEEDGSFEEEYELPPSDRFLEAVTDWEYERRAEMEREFGRWDG